MKLTTIVTVVAAIGAEVAFASPVAQQAPVKPNPQPNCLPNGCYTSQAGLPGSACCSGYFANGCCKPHPRLLAKDLDPKIRALGPNPCAGDNVCTADPKPTDPAPAPAPAPAPTDAPETKTQLCFSSTLAGPDGLTAATSPCPTPGADPKTKLCFASTALGLDGLTAATSPCPGEATAPAQGGGGVVSQISDGQVQAPTSASGNPVSLSTVGNKGAADIVPPTVLPAEPFEPYTVTGSSPSSVFTDLFPQPTFDTAATEVPVPTSSPSSEFTDLFPQPSFVTTFPSEPTVTGSSTHLHPHVPISIGTKQPLGPGWSHSLPHQPLPPHNPTLPHKPYPTETYIGAWDPELPPISTAGSDGHQPLPPHKPTHPHKPYPTETYIGAWDPELPPVSTACSDGPPLPTTPSWTYEKRAEESISVHHIGPGWDHSLAHQPLPTTLATVILDESSAEESTSVHHVGPGWDHSLAHQPLPTTLVTVVLEERNAEEATFAHRVGPGWDHSLAHQPIPTRRARIVETESVHHVGPGWSHTIAWRPLPTSQEASTSSPYRIDTNN